MAVASSLLENSSFISGLFSLGGVVVALVLKELYDRRKSRVASRREDFQHQDISQQKFRDTLIQQLTETRDALNASEAREAETERRLLVAERAANDQKIKDDRKIAKLMWAVEHLCREIKARDPLFDDAFCRQERTEDA